MKKLIALLSSLALLVFPKWKANGCVDFPMPEHYRIYLMQPDITGKSHMSPLYFSTNYFFNLDESFMEMDAAAEQKNIEEWEKYFKGAYSKEFLKQVLYGIAAGCVEVPACRDSLVNKYPQAKKLFDGKNPAGIYIGYMHRCLYELNSWYYPWWEQNTLSMTGTLELAEEGEELLKKYKKDEFLKKRVALQLIRLYYYRIFYGGTFNDEQNKVEAIYSTYFNKDKISSWVDGAAFFYYILSGGTKEDFNYQLSLAYDRSDEKKFRCVQLFERKKLEATLTYAKNNHEKAVMQAMWLMQFPGRGLNRLETIYNLEPGYKDFDILLSRELNKLEDWILTPEVVGGFPANPAREEGYEYNWERNHDSIATANKAADYQYLDKVIAFSQKILTDNNKKSKALWNLYLARLYQLKGDAISYEKYIDAAEAENKTEKNERITRQLSIDKLLLHFMKAKELDEEGKQLILNFDKLAKNSPGTLLPAIENKVLQLVGIMLHEKGQTGWGGLLINKSSETPYGPILEMDNYANIYHFITQNGNDKDIELVVNIIEKDRNRTEFENFLMTYSERDTSYQYSPPFLIEKNKLLDYYAKIYVKQDSLEKALSYLNRIDTAYWKGELHKPFSQDNPFIVDVYDPHNYNKRDTPFYNLPTFIKGIIQLKEEINNNPTKKDSLYFVLGNAYYNMSWHGKMWIAQEFWWSAYHYPPYGYSTYIAADYKNRDYYTTGKARYWYEQALKNTKNTKLAAAATLMAAKCLRNYTYIVNEERWNIDEKYELPNVDLEKNEYADYYRQHFKNHKLYEDMVNYCDTWQDFMNTWAKNTRRKGPAERPQEGEE